MTPVTLQVTEDLLDLLAARVAPVGIPRIAVSKADAARALGVSVDSFDRYVGSQVRCVRRGRLRLYPVAELERWADQNAEHLLDHGDPR